LAFCGGGIWGSVQFDESIPYVMDRAEDIGNMLVSKALPVYVDIGRLQQYISDTDELTMLLNDATKLASEVSDHRSDIDAAELTRHIVVLVLFGIVVLACGVGILAAVFAWGLPSLAFAVVLWITLIWMCVVCGAHLSASVAVGDICETVDEYIQNDFFSSSAETTIASHYLFCDGSPALQDLVSDVQNLTQLANTSLQNAERDGNQTQIDYWTQILNYTGILSSDLNILLQCDTTSQNYHDAKYKICTDLILGAFIVTTGEFIVGVFGFALLVLGLIGYKRFPRPLGYVELGDEFSLAEQDKALYPGMEPVALNAENRDRKRVSLFA